MLSMKIKFKRVIAGSYISDPIIFRRRNKIGVIKSFFHLPLIFIFS